MSLPTSSIPHHYFANTAACLGGFIVLNNIYGALNPRGALSMLGFPPPAATSSDAVLVEGMTRMLAGTRICLGISTIAMWYYRADKALGVSMLAGFIMAGVDGFVSKAVIGKGQWGHWGFIPVGTAVGLGLLMTS